MGKSFGVKSRLNTHIATVHENERSIECPKCPETFGQTAHLNTHIANVHEGHKHTLIIHDLKTHRTTVHEGQKSYEEQNQPEENTEEVLGI